MNKGLPGKSRSPGELSTAVNTSQTDIFTTFTQSSQNCTGTVRTIGMNSSSCCVHRTLTRFGVGGRRRCRPRTAAAGRWALRTRQNRWPTASAGLLQAFCRRSSPRRGPRSRHPGPATVRPEQRGPTRTIYCRSNGAAACAGRPTAQTGLRRPAAAVRGPRCLARSTAAVPTESRAPRSRRT